MQLEALLYLAEEVGDVEPLDAAVVQKIARAQVDRLDEKDSCVTCVVRDLSRTPPLHPEKKKVLTCLQDF